MHVETKDGFLLTQTKIFPQTSLPDVSDNVCIRRLRHSHIQFNVKTSSTCRPLLGISRWGGALWLPQVLIKPRKIAGVHWWQGGRAAIQPPLPLYDTLVTGMILPSQKVAARDAFLSDSEVF